MRAFIVLRLGALTIALCAACATAHAAARFAVATGNWNQTGPTIWAASSGGAAGASIPVAGDTVTIGETATARTVTIPAGYAAAATSVTIGNTAQPGGRALTFAAASSTLAVSGAVVVNGPNTNTTNALNVNAGTATINGGLTLTGGINTRVAQLSISTGTATVGGTLTAANANSRVVFSAAGTLNIGVDYTNGGVLTPSTGTVRYNGGGAQNVGAYTYNNLTIAKGGGAAAITANTTVGGNLSVSAGTLNVPGFNLTVTGTTSVSGTLAFITSTAGTKIFTGAVTIDPGGVWNNAINEAITLNGNFTNSGTFTAGTGVYTFSGGAAQTITGTAAGASIFGNLTLSNTNGLSLTGATHNVTVNTTLTLCNGCRVTTNANTLSIASGNAIAGANATSFVVGNLAKRFPVAGGATLRAYEIGTTSGGVEYAPVSLTMNAVTVAGDVAVSSTDGAHPQIASSGLDTTTPHKLNRYWTVTNSGVAFATYDAQLTFVAADVDAGANPLSFVATRYFPAAPAAGTWNPTTDAGNTATTITVTGLTGFGDFAVGEPLDYNAGIGRFNAYDPAPLTPVGAIHGLIRTKVAGTAFSLTVVHLDPGGTALQAMGSAQTVTVALIDGSTTTAPFANNCWASWLAAPVIQSVTINFTAVQTTGTANFAAVTNVYRDVRVRITGGGQTGCSSDRFAIRPISIAVAATDTDWASAGAGRALTNAGASGGVVHKAGQPFTVTATPSPGTATLYSGNPVASAIACVLPAGCATGTLNFGAWAGAGARSSSATYTEAGTFNLTIEDQTFAQVDVADSTAAQRYVPHTGGGPTLVGRFVPDHFDLAVDNPAGTGPTFRTFGNTCASRSFTYIGQTFGYVAGQEPRALITARNASGGTTVNYSGTLWKLASASVSQAYANTPAMTLTTTTNAASVAATAGVTGTGTVVVNSGDSIAYTRDPATPLAPFNADLALTLGVTDTSENAAGQAGGILTTTPAVFSSIAFDSGNELRYGRLRLQNGYGSQLIAMPIPIQAQFWNGTSFATNTADNCTTFAAANVALGNYQKNLNAGETTVSVGGAFSAGVGSLRLSAPGAANTGSVDVSVNLTNGTAGASCTAGMPASTGSTQAYLQGAWCGATYTRDPTARATFGLFRDTDRLIYQRENF